MFNIKIESKEVSELKEKIEELRKELAYVRTEKELNVKGYEINLEITKQESDIKLKNETIGVRELLIKREAEIENLKQLLETERNFHKTNIETINKNLEKIESTYKESIKLLKDTNNNETLKQLIEALPKVNINSISPDINLNNNNKN
jgi:lipoate synthase